MLDLDEIQTRHKKVMDAYRRPPTSEQEIMNTAALEGVLIGTDVPALVAEITSLRHALREIHALSRSL